MAYDSHPPHSSASPVELRLRVGPRASQDAKVDLKPLIVSVIPIYSLSETMFLFYFLVFILINKLIKFSAS
jgi:hypothetical protein